MGAQIKYYHEYVAIHKNLQKSPASYSVKVKGLPHDKSAKEIREFFYANTPVHDDAIGENWIRSVNVAYDISEYIDLVDKKLKLVKGVVQKKLQIEELSKKK